MQTLDERFDGDGGEIRWTSIGNGPPIVLVHGTPYAEWIAARLPDARLSWEDDAGHLLAEDAPARLLAEILAQPQVR